MFKQNLHRNREVILPDISIHTGITGILNFFLSMLQFSPKRKFKNKKFRTDIQI